MNKLCENTSIRFISAYGHLTYTMNCPVCGFDSEKHDSAYPEIINCPYCKSEFEYDSQSGKRIWIEIKSHRTQRFTDFAG